MPSAIDPSRLSGLSLKVLRRDPDSPTTSPTMPNKHLRIDANCTAIVRDNGVVEVDVYNPMWQWQTWALWGFKDQAGLDKELRRWGSGVDTGDREFDSWSGLHIPVTNRKCGRSASIMLLKEAPTSPFAAGVLAHEALHAAWMCLKDTGVKLDDDEVVAYTQQFIVHRVLQVAVKVSGQPSAAASSA